MSDGIVIALIVGAVTLINTYMTLRGHKQTRDTIRENAGATQDTVKVVARSAEASANYLEKQAAFNEENLHPKNGQTLAQTVEAIETMMKSQNEVLGKHGDSLNEQVDKWDQLAEAFLDHTKNDRHKKVEPNE